MANAEHLETLKQGAVVWNKWRERNPKILPDLADATLTETELVGACLRRGDLRRVKFGNTDLAGTDLRETDLRGADLICVTGPLQSEQLAGADLAGAALPESLRALFKDLNAAKGISDNAQKLFVAMLAACLYSWLTIATTTDISLVTNRASSPLPVIQTSIPIVGFYVVTPLLLLGLYFYFHFYLQKLWEELGGLPAFFPDGRPLQSKADPWLLSDLVRSHVSKLSAGRPFFSYLQKWISILLAWWLLPVTLVLFWARYLSRHELLGTVFHCALTSICVSAAVFLYGLAARTLSGTERKAFAWSSALRNTRAYGAFAVVAAAAVLLFVISIGAVKGARLPTSDRDWWPRSYGPSSWVPRAMALIGYAPFADLRAADLSLKPANWTGKSETEWKPSKGFSCTAWICGMPTSEERSCLARS